MYSKLKIIIMILLSSSSLAKLSVVTTTTDIAWLVSQVGGEKVQVKSLLQGTENPHYVEALPSFMHKVASVDILCVVGLSLETAWISKVQARAGNKKVQLGSEGFCDASTEVQVLEKLETSVDRSHGDVHSEGNPHYHIAPSYMAMAAKSILKTLIQVDPPNSSYYTTNVENLEKSLAKIKKTQEERIKLKKHMRFMEYHKEFTYFLKDYNLEGHGSVESISGVPPSAARVLNVVNLIKNKKINFILATDNAPDRILRKLAEETGVKIIKTPLSIIDYSKDEAYKELQENIFNKILK